MIAQTYLKEITTELEFIFLIYILAMQTTFLLLWMSVNRTKQ